MPKAITPIILILCGASGAFAQRVVQHAWAVANQSLIVDLAQGLDGKILVPGTRSLKAFDRDGVFQWASPRQGAKRAAVSPDGKVYSSAEPRFVTEQDGETGATVRRIGPFDSPINGTAVSPDGKVLIVGLRTGYSFVDVATGFPFAAWSSEGFSEWFRHAFAPDGSVFLANNASLRHFEVSSGRLLETVDTEPVVEVGLSSDGSRLYYARSGHDNPQLRCLDTATRQVVWSDPSFVESLRLGANGDSLVAGGYAIYRFDPQTGAREEYASSSLAPICGLTETGGGKVLFGYMDGQAEYRQLDDLSRPVGRLMPGSAAYEVIGYCRDAASWVVRTLPDKAISLLDAETGRFGATLSVPGEFDFSLSPNGRYLASRKDGTVRLYDLVSKTLVGQAAYNGTPVPLNDGRRVIVCSNNTIEVDVPTGTILRSMTPTGGPQLSEDGERLVLSKFDRVLVYRTSDFVLLGGFIHASGVERAVSPSGDYMAIVESRVVKVYESRTGRLVGAIAWPVAAAKSTSLQRWNWVSGDLLAMVAYQPVVRLVTPSGQQVDSFRTEWPENPQSLAASPDGSRWLMSAADASLVSLRVR
ncbi:MAG: WD40 repeat domain-containing protein [Fimbriimonadaceae bacterium]|nr:WD40 repeat domain-containing protein [Fimbriimonadaceae bacterium]QYK54859.1 MAG: WD40 repeat domain-containing protein [Fimbriimonadaceae bacterium]